LARYSTLIVPVISQSPDWASKHLITPGFGLFPPCPGWPANAIVIDRSNQLYGGGNNRRSHPINCHAATS